MTSFNSFKSQLLIKLANQLNLTKQKVKNIGNVNIK